MKSEINRVTLMGRTGADPSVRNTASGVQLGILSLASHRFRKKSGSDEKEECTEWHRVVCWGKLAEKVGISVRKGDRIYVEGVLRKTKYQSADGKEYSLTEIHADRVDTIAKENSPLFGKLAEGEITEPNLLNAGAG